MVVQKTLNFNNNKIIVYADTREVYSGVIQELYNWGVEVKVKKLDLADYIVSQRVAIERKEVKDFAKSVIDKRLFEQAARLRETYEHPILIIEGKNIYQNLHPNAILGALATLICDFNMCVVRTTNYIETAKLIYMLAKREQKENKQEIAIRAKKKAMSLAEQQRFIVEGLPYVSATIAKRLLKKFGTVRRVFTASEAELSNIKGIGEKRAKEIIKILTTPYRDDV